MRVNCFNTVIPEGAKPRTVLLSISGSTVQGLEFDGHRHQNLVTMDLADIDGAKLEVTHYYGLDTVRYEGVFRLAIGSVTKWPYLLIHALRLKNLLLQRWFNAREMKLGDRLTVLQDVANLTNEGVQKIGAQEVMSHRYGYRWAAHPGWLAFQQRLDRQLELLAQAGDLSTADSFSYRLAGQGVRTLDDRRDASRKHGANWRMQFALWVVAVLAAGFTAAQTGLVKLPTVFDWQTSKTASSPDATPSAASAGRPAASSSPMPSSAASR